jgi:hypothetical protein
MAWTTTTLTVSDVADSVITRWDEGVMLGYTPELIVNQVATINVQANAKVVQFTKYSNLTQISSALTEDADATSVVLVDTAYTLTPLEYGNTVTSSKLVDFQTNGKGSRAAALVIGRNMGSSVDKLGVTPLRQRPVLARVTTSTACSLEGFTTSSPGTTSPESADSTSVSLTMTVFMISGKLWSPWRSIRVSPLFCKTRSGWRLVFAGSAVPTSPSRTVVARVLSIAMLFRSWVPTLWVWRSLKLRIRSSLDRMTNSIGS